MLRWLIVVVVGLVAFTGCVMLTPPAVQLKQDLDELRVGARVEPLEAPIPVYTLDLDELDSLVVTVGGVGYLDLVNCGDGTWKNFAPGAEHTLPEGWLETLVEILESLEVTHRAVLWNDSRYGPPGLSIAARNHDDPDTRLNFWVGSREAQGIPTRGQVKFGGKAPPGDVPGYRTCVFPEEWDWNEESYAISAEGIERLEEHVRPLLRDPSRIDTKKRD